MTSEEKIQREQNEWISAPLQRQMFSQKSRSWSSHPYICITCHNAANFPTSKMEAGSSKILTYLQIYIVQQPR